MKKINYIENKNTLNYFNVFVNTNNPFSLTKISQKNILISVREVSYTQNN